MAIVDYLKGISGFGKLRRSAGGLAGQLNLDINSSWDSKPVRVNSRDYDSVNTNNIGMQCKPNQAVTGSASITGAEFSPRYADGIGGGQIRAIAASPFLKGTTGNLSSNVVAVEAEFSLGSNSTRTITGGVHAMRVILDAAGTMTVTGKKSVFKIDAPLAAGDWDYLIQLDSPNLLVAATNSVIDHAIPIRVGSTNYWIGVYDATS